MIGSVCHDLSACHSIIRPSPSVTSFLPPEAALKLHFNVQTQDFGLSLARPQRCRLALRDRSEEAQIRCNFVDSILEFRTRTRHFPHANDSSARYILNIPPVSGLLQYTCSSSTNLELATPSSRAHPSIWATVHWIAKSKSPEGWASTCQSCWYVPSAPPVRPFSWLRPTEGPHLLSSWQPSTMVPAHPQLLVTTLPTLDAKSAERSVHMIEKK